MSEKFTIHQDKDDGNESNERPSQTEGTSSWRSSEHATEPKPWWHESEKSAPLIPASEDVRQHADRQARIVTELSLDDDETEVKDKEKSKDKTTESKTEEKSPHEPRVEKEAASEQKSPEEKPTEATHESVKEEASPEVDEQSTEAAKEIAHEELEAHEGEIAEDDPTVDYLEKVADEGQPAEAEQATIEEHDLETVQSEADQLIEDLEKLLEAARERVGDRELTDDEMLELAHEMLPDTEENQEETNPEAFAPEPSGAPELPHILTHPDQEKTDSTLSASTIHHKFSASPVTPISGAGSPLPPLPPSGGGGGGGGGSGGSGGGGINRFASLAGAVNPNMHPLWQGLSAAERARLHRKKPSHALLAGVLGYYLGKHFGKKKGQREKEAELKPKLEKQEKTNKRQRDEIMAGQKRIESLKRIKDAQEQELVKNKHQEHVVHPLSTPSPEAPSAPRHPERSEPENAPALPPEAERASFSQPSPEESTSPTPESVETRIPAGPVPESFEAPATAPEVPQEPAIRSPEFVPSVPAETSPITETQAETERPWVVEKSAEKTEPTLAQEESILPIQEKGESKSVRPDIERAVDTGARPEIASTAPGLEVPLSAVSPEIAPAVSSLFTASPEHRGAVASSREPEAVAPEAVSAMNLPELITVAKEITIGGESLGRIFEGRQIDNAGLRRVVAEYARGGDPEKVLAQERHVMELRRQSPEFLQTNPAGTSPGGSAAGGGGSGTGGGLFAQATQNPDHMLPAYDHEQYPSDTPQHLLPAYDQETVTQKHHRTIVAASALTGLGIGILLAVLFI